MCIRDSTYCSQKGIHVIATSPVFSKPVAEIALGMTLSLLRNIHNAHFDFIKGKEKGGEVVYKIYKKFMQGGFTGNEKKQAEKIFDEAKQRQPNIKDRPGKALARRGGGLDSEGALCEVLRALQ